MGKPTTSSEKTEPAVETPEQKEASAEEAAEKKSKENPTKPKAKGKAKAKAAAKGKAKAKPKGKAKAKAKAEPKGKPKGKAQPKSKPNSKGKDEEQEAEDDESKNEETRDVGKARKMARMLKAGNVPEDVRKLYESANQQSNPRLFKTELINRLFQVNKSGNYTMCTTSPDFQSWKANTDTKFSEGYSTGESYSVMLWKVFHGNEEALKTALRRGDVYEQGGLYHTLTVRTGRTKTSNDTQQLSGGCASLDVEQFDALSSFFSGRPWALQGSQSFETATNRESGPETSVVLGNSSGQRQLALQDKPAVEVEVKWKVVETNLSEAKQALDRLQRDAQRYVSKVKLLGDSDLSEEIHT
ncbi:unnamed protein product [Symbiodinium sp. CCMP2592]|nr:unnamed protein product [Symbiodinium sp. CCMP2592]CAE7376635.1 unnamed protein product [Symbiodinium sp. CCMP2592]